MSTKFYLIEGVEPSGMGPGADRSGVGGWEEGFIVEAESNPEAQADLRRRFPGLEITRVKDLSLVPGSGCIPCVYAHLVSAFEFSALLDRAGLRSVPAEDASI